MNIIIHLIIVFVFIFALLMLNIPQIQHDNHLQQKLYIFCGVFILDFIIALFIAIHRKQVINFGKIIRESLLSGVIAVSGYSVYTDLVWNGNSWVSGEQSVYQENINITIIVTAFLAAGYLFNMLVDHLSPTMNDCLNTIYRNKTK